MASSSVLLAVNPLSCCHIPHPRRRWNAGGGASKRGGMRASAVVVANHPNHPCIKIMGVDMCCKVLLSVSLGVAAATIGTPSCPNGGGGAYAATTEVVVASASNLPAAQSEMARLGDKAMYALDYFFATRTGGKTIMLLAVCAFFTAVGGVMYHYFGGTDSSVPESMWTAWTFIADSGAHAEQETFRKRLVAVPITLVGMLFFALLVGLVTDAVAEKVDQLSKGKSRVLESNHTLIIGWTKKTIPLVKELTTANKARGIKRSIVILGNVKKEEMDSMLQDNLPVRERFGTKVVTRNGSSTSLEALRLCSVSEARNIVVLSPVASSPMEADALVCQACLFLSSIPQARGNVIAELRELDHVQELGGLVRSILPYDAPHKNVRYRKIVPVAAGDLAMRIIVKQVLQPGIVAVGRELLRFEGSEFHLKCWPELAGRTFGEIVFMFENAIPCGIRKSFKSGESRTLVNPALETVFEKGDKLLVIAEDESSYKPGSPNTGTSIVTRDIHKSILEMQKPRVKILIIGWKNDLKDVIQLIDASVSGGSEVAILSDVPEDVRAEEFQGLVLKHLTLEQKYGDPLFLKVLRELPLEKYDKVVLLSDKEKPCNHNSLYAMFVRYLQVERGSSESTIIAELPTVAEWEGAVRSPWVSEAVDSEQLEAMLLAQLAEDVEVGAVLDEVVSDAGSNMLLQPATGYLKQPEEMVSFYELQRRALARGLLLIAHKRDGGWRVNPANKSTPLRWCADDELLLLTPPVATGLLNSS